MEPLGVTVVCGDANTFQPSADYAAALLFVLQATAALAIGDTLVNACREHQVRTVIASDLLALTLLEAPVIGAPMRALVRRSDLACRWVLATACWFLALAET